MDFSFHSALRLVHIAAGALGLVCFWIPIFATKGGKLHLAAGRVFVGLARVIIVTAAISCIWALSAPVHFAGITRALTDEEIRMLSANIRFFFGLLGLLTTWFVASLQVGLRAIRTRRNQAELGDVPTRLAVIVSILASAVAFAGGGYFYVVTGEPRYCALIGLGIFGVVEGRKTYRVLVRTGHGKMDWWYLHMESMLGLGIAFHTAFFVFGGSRLWGELPGIWKIVPWLLPTVIGATANSIWTSYYRRKFESTDEETPALTQSESAEHAVS